MTRRRLLPLALLAAGPLFVAPFRSTCLRQRIEPRGLRPEVLPVLLAPLAAHAEDGSDWFEPFVSFNAQVIESIDGLVGSAGVAIVIYTLIIKALTYPLQQPALRTSSLIQLLSPQTDEIERQYPLDEEGRGKALRELYAKVGLNPFAAFLPILFQLPIFIALFRAIGKLAAQDEHFKEPFLWIPSLAGPVESGRPSLDWLLKTRASDHFEPLVGWQDAGFYLVLPLLVFLIQFFSNRMSAASRESVSGSVLAPLFIAISTLVSPQGVGVYWFTNTLLTTAQLKLTQNEVAQEFPDYKAIKDSVDAEMGGLRPTRSSTKPNKLLRESVKDLGDQKVQKKESRSARRKRARR